MLTHRHQEVFGNTIEMNQLQTTIIVYFSADNKNSVLFKFKQQITGKTGNGNTKDVKIMIPIKYLIFGEFLHCQLTGAKNEIINGNVKKCQTCFAHKK